MQKYDKMFTLLLCLGDSGTLLYHIEYCMFRCWKYGNISSINTFPFLNTC